MNLRTVKDIKDLEGKVVFVRGDLDVPIKLVDGQWCVEDDYRLNAMYETIYFLRSAKARILLAGHIDRPGGRPDSTKSTKVIADYYKNQFPNTTFVPYCCGSEVEKEINKMVLGQILVLENLRFLPGEEENDEELARNLAELAKYYVNEDFSNCHREHASMTKITKFLPSFAGFHLQREVQMLNSVLENPARPLYVVIGGAKVETKLPLIKSFLNVADKIFVGGKTGCSSDELLRFGPKVVYSCGDPDLSFNTAKSWAVELLNARTIVWNGPLGDISNNQVLGTDLVSRSIVEATNSGAKSVVGGGDTEKYLRSSELVKDVTFISTGGGAMLEYLSGIKLPALEPLLIK